MPRHEEQSEKPRTRPSRVSGPYLLIAAAALLLWGHTVRYRFVWDDHPYIVNLESIRSLSNLPRMFYDPSAQMDTSHPYTAMPFRPLRNVQYALLVAAGGSGRPIPWIFHLASVAWHLAAGLLLYALARRLLVVTDAGDGSPPRSVAAVRWTAAWVAVAFIVHPVVSEVVCWAKSLDDSMASAFVFAAMLCLADPEGRRGRYAASLLLFVLAAYAKVSAAPFGLVVFAWYALVRRVRLRAAVLRALPFLFLAALYLFHRDRVLGATRQVAPISGSYGQTLLDMTEAVVRYGRLLLGIPPFHFDYAFMKGGHAWSDPVVWGGLALCAALAAVILAGFFRPRWRLPSFGAAWFAVFMLPVSNLVPMMQYMAERFLYLPLAGLLLAVAAALRGLLRRDLLAVLGIGVVLAWSYAAWERAQVWRDEFTLFTSTDADTSSWRVEANVIRIGLDQPVVQRFLRGELPPAEVEARWPAVHRTLAQLREWYPDNVIVLNSCAAAALVRREYEDALADARHARRVDPDAPESYVNAALALSGLQRRDEGAAVLDEGLARLPDNAALRNLRQSPLFGPNDPPGGTAPAENVP